MNIGERFYCSRCLAELENEGTCKKCGYDPSSPEDPSALEEGTLLHNMRFQIGAVFEKLRIGYIYGAYDYLAHKPVHIFEYFPEDCSGLTRESISGTRITAPEHCRKAFNDGRNDLVRTLGRYCEMFEENNTVYISKFIQSVHETKRQPSEKLILSR